MPINIYPPILKSTQPAFLANTTRYLVKFTLQSITSFNDIGHIQLRVVRQSNNRSIVNTSVYPDGIIYKSSSEIGVIDSEYYISIDTSSPNKSDWDLSEQWCPGYLYKIQIRFGTNTKYTSLQDFATWKKEQIDQSAFSEWSTVMIIKAIDTPDVQVRNALTGQQDAISSKNIETTLTPLFTGLFSISNDSKESVDKYKFDLYKGIGELELIETSGWLQHINDNIEDTGIGKISSYDEFRFKTMLSNNEDYTVTYSIITVNGYEKTSSYYSFLTFMVYLSNLTGIKLIVEDDTDYCRENGCINIYCSAEQKFSGTYVLTRTSEVSNFQVWEDLVYLNYSMKTLDDTLVYQDFTIESGIKYRYALQQENSKGLRTPPIFNEDKLYNSVDFEYSFLYHNGVQLRLAFDNKLSSFKYTTLRTKQDTLGDRYPHLTQNGEAYYAEFPITGLISLQMDSDSTFFTLKEDGYYYEEELVIPIDKIPEDNVATDLSGNNFFMERIFRSKVEQFLNNFDYKLYKSPSEGNIIVNLMNVSLTPNATLGRMIYSFSATAYEVLQNTLENLNEFNIIDIGEFTPISEDSVSLSFGQVRGLYGSNLDIYEMIRQQEEGSIGGGYEAKLKWVTFIEVEPYPQIDFTAELLRLYALKDQALVNGESTIKLDSQIAEYEGLIKALEGASATTTILNVNGSNIVIAPNKIYQLSEKITSLSLVSAASPIIINYICELIQTEDDDVEIAAAIDVTRIWGQLYGVFTDSDSILETYGYKDSETYRIYNGIAEGGEIYDNSPDNATFNVYDSINLYDVIKEETQKQVEEIYNTKFEEDEDGLLTNGLIYYEFNDITSFDIEADEGTILYIGKEEDGSDAIEVQIGSTCRYALNPMTDMIKYIVLGSPQFCVVNYQCITNQITKTEME